MREEYELFSRPIKENEVVFMFFGYSSVVFRVGEYTIGVDIASLPPEIFDKISRVNFVLYTHSHSDHFNLDTALKAYERWVSVIMAEENTHKELYPYLPSSNLIKLKPRVKARIRDLTIIAIEGKHVCPILLYFISYGKITIFHGGDSGYVDLSKMRANIAFVPVGYPSPTASPENAARMVEDLEPEYTIPIHGRDIDFRDFKRIIEERGIKTKIIEPTIGKVYLIEVS